MSQINTVNGGISATRFALDCDRPTINYRTKNLITEPAFTQYIRTNDDGTSEGDLLLFSRGSFCLGCRTKDKNFVQLDFLVGALFVA